MTQNDQHTAARVADVAAKVEAAINTVVRGKPEVVRLATLAVLARGHVLIEDVPGVGKTTAAKALGHALGGRVRRVQCTPDLLPSDITGSSIYNQKTAEFEFKPGPIFGNVVVADEINRAEPKTQSALLECMEENQVTVDGKTYRLPTPFTVLATQNPIEMHGTFALPEAQRDRFMLHLTIGYPSAESEISAVTDAAIASGVASARQVTDVQEMAECITAVSAVALSGPAAKYIVDIVRATRHSEDITLGASTRAAVHLGRASRAAAAMAGALYVSPDHVKELAIPVLAHRLMLAPHAAGRGLTPRKAVAKILHMVPADSALSGSA